MKTINVVALSVFGLSGCTLDVSNEETPTETVEVTNPIMGGPSSPHCVIRLPSNDVSCYSTFREAIAFATGGRIADAPEAGVALADEDFASRINALSAIPHVGTVIGIDFKDAKWQGSTLTWNTSSGCDGNTATRDFFAASLPSGWNDTISSFRSFANCLTVLHENINFGGTTLTGVDVSFGGSAMDDAASSIEWF